MKIKIPFLILCISLSFINGIAQNILIKNISVAHGLSQSTVNDIIQDQFGYIWVSTGDGLNRFDGNRFKYFKYKERVSNALPSNMIRKLIEDTIRKRIWVGTDNGICYYDQRKGELFQPFKNIDAFKNAFCVPLKINAEFLWFCIGNKGIGKINIKTLSITMLDRFVIKSMIGVNQNSTDVLYRKRDNYLHRIQLYTNQIDSIPWESNFPDLIYSNFRQIGSNTYSIFTSLGVFKADFNTHNFSPIETPKLLPKAIITDIEIDSEGNSYFALLGKGIYIFNKQDELINTFLGEYELRSNEVFNTQTIWHFFIDNRKTIWCTTDVSGLVLIDLRAEKFKPLKWGSKDDYTRSSRIFSKSITEINDQLWVGTSSDGIYIIPQKTNKSKFEHLVFNRNKQQIKSISKIVDCGKFVLLGSETGLFKLNKPYDPTQLTCIENKLDVNDILKIGDSCLIASKTGVYIYSINSNTLKHSDIVQSMNTSVLYCDKYNTIWIGMNSEGLFYVPRIGKAKHISLFDPQDKLKHVKIPNLDINSIIQLEKSIFCATNHGLFEINDRLEVINRYTSQDGLSNDHIYGLLKDEIGRLWISSNNGVSRFDPKNRVFENYSTSDGLQSLEHNKGAFFQNDAGLCFFGGTSGISQFSPSQLNIPIKYPEIKLSSIQVMNQNIENIDSLIFNNDIPNFHYNQNNFQFEVSILDFFNANHYELEYFLEGWDKKFNQLGKNHLIRYTNLPPGVYTLICRVIGSSKELNTASRVLTFRIITPVWKKAWFWGVIILLSIALLLSIVFLFINNRNKKSIAKIERIREIEKMRSRISKDIHDEVGAGLTKITLMSEAAKIDSLSDISMEVTLEKLANEARNVSKGLHEIIWSVNPDADNSSSLFDHINQYSREFLEDTDLKLTIEINEEYKMQLSPHNRRNIFLIIKEGLNNIVKHAAANEVRLLLSTSNNQTIYIKLSDDGVGITDKIEKAASAQLNSKTRIKHGLKNMQSRAESCGLNFSIHSESDTGTSIVLNGREEEML